jgi:hypothetical protein
MERISEDFDGAEVGWGTLSSVLVQKSTSCLVLEWLDIGRGAVWKGVGARGALEPEDRQERDNCIK